MKNTDWRSLISFVSNVSAGKAYRYTAAVLILSGLFYFTMLSFVNEVAQLIFLGAAGTLMTALICSFFNLMYFLKNVSPFVRYVLPGMLFLVFVLIVYSNAKPDIYVFLGFGILNQLAGVFWYLREKQFILLR